MTFFLAACLSALAYLTIGLLATGTFSFGIGCLVMVHLIIAGFSASLATINAIHAVMRNYNRVMAILPLTLLISYMKMAKMFDESIKAVLFPEADLSTYMIWMALITATTYVLCIFFCRKIEMTEANKRECADSDLYGLILFYIVLIAWSMLSYFAKYVSSNEKAPFTIALVGGTVNLLCVPIAACFQIKALDNESEPPPIGDTLRFWPHIKTIKYWAVVISSFSIVGVCYSMNDYGAYQTLMGANSVNAEQMFWTSDMCGRLVGGILVFALSKKVNEYLWAVVFSTLGFIGTVIVFFLTLSS
jgi:hypothetical protein